MSWRAVICQMMGILAVLSKSASSAVTISLEPSSPPSKWASGPYYSRRGAGQPSTHGAFWTSTLPEQPGSYGLRGIRLPDNRLSVIKAARFRRPRRRADVTARCRTGDQRVQNFAQERGELGPFNPSQAVPVTCDRLSLAPRLMQRATCLLVFEGTPANCRGRHRRTHRGSASSRGSLIFRVAATRLLPRGSTRRDLN
jgi:hypothetical protein